jgi:hypothetical protein
MLARNVAISKKLTMIKWSTEALYYRGFPFLDDAGRMTADPEEYRGILIPLGKNSKAIPMSLIEAAIQELYQVGLIGLCKCENKHCMEYADFLRFQVLRADRDPVLECVSVDKIPVDMTWYAIDMTLTPSRAPAEVNLREVNINKEKRTSPEYDDDFLQWWNRYPRKAGKKKARECYDGLRDEGVPAQLLLDAATAYRSEMFAAKTEQAFIKHPATFLGPQCFYEDYAAMKGWSEKDNG